MNPEQERAEEWLMGYGDEPPKSTPMICRGEDGKKWLPIMCMTCDGTGVSESMAGTERLCTRCGGSLLMFVRPFGFVLTVKMDNRDRWKRLRREGVRIYGEMIKEGG